MKQNKKIPFEFVLDCLYPQDVTIKPMFGCFGVYVDRRMVFFLRDRQARPELNGVWVATTPDHSASLSKTFPSLIRDLKFVEEKESSHTWLLFSSRDEEFETVVTKACKLVVKGDARIGKVTKSSLEL